MFQNGGRLNPWHKNLDVHQSEAIKIQKIAAKFLVKYRVESILTGKPLRPCVYEIENAWTVLFFFRIIANMRRGYVDRAVKVSGDREMILFEQTHSVAFHESNSNPIFYLAYFILTIFVV